MSSRRGQLTIILCLILLIMTAFVAWRSFCISEPVYRGKRLTGWVEQWKTNRWSIPKADSNRIAEKQAEAAIRAIGTNGIPFLLELMQAREPGWRAKAREIVPRSWHARLRLNGMAGRKKEVGANGLAALGEQAASAVPELIELVKSPDYFTSYLAVWALGNPGVATESAAPVLVGCLTNRDESIRIDALHGLGRVPGASIVIVPALLQHLPFAKSRNGNGELCAVVHALGMQHTNATTAVPVLVELLQHPDFTVRSYATSSLRRIDKMVADKHGVHRP
jgi:hypothetical protein